MPPSLNVIVINRHCGPLESRELLVEVPPKGDAYLSFAVRFENIMEMLRVRKRDCNDGVIIMD